MLEAEEMMEPQGAEEMEQSPEPEQGFEVPDLMFVDPNEEDDDQEGDKGAEDGAEEAEEKSEEGSESGLVFGEAAISRDAAQEWLDAVSMAEADNADFFGEEGLHVVVEGEVVKGAPAVRHLIQGGAAMERFSRLVMEEPSLAAGFVTAQIVAAHGDGKLEDAPVINPEDLDWDTMEPVARALYAGMRVLVNENQGLRDGAADLLKRQREQEEDAKHERVADREAAVLSRKLGVKITGDEVLEARRATGIKDAEAAVSRHALMKRGQPEGARSQAGGAAGKDGRGRAPVAVPKSRSQPKRADLSGLPLAQIMKLMDQGWEDDPKAPPYKDGSETD